MAIADAVHLLVSMKHEMHLGKNKVDAMVESMRINFWPIFVTSLTTVLGFLSLNFSDAPPFHDLGNIAAIGVAAAFIYSITFLPALITILPAKSTREVTGKYAMGHFGDFVIRNYRTLLVVSSLVVIAMVAMVPKNELNDVFVEYFDKTIDFRLDSDYAAENLTGVYYIDFSLGTGENGGISDPLYLKNVDRFVQYLRTQPEVIHVFSITDIFKRLNKNMHGDDPAWYRLPDDRNLAAQYLLLYEMSLPYGLDLNNQIDVGKTATKIAITLKTLSSNEVLALEQRISAWLAQNMPELEGSGTGPTVMFAHLGKRNINSMLIGTTIALVMISMVLIVFFRSLRYGLISLLPNLLPAAAAFGIWGLFVGQVGIALSVVTGMTLGIVVDDTVHFMSKYLRARREKGFNAEQAVHYAFNSVGIALLVTSVVLIAGFMIMAQSHFELNAGMGLLTSVVIALALAIDFMLLPPLLIKLEENGEKKV
jgi:predicted RND superfamily exporter protein